jgi:hypothetical protein
MPPPTVRQRIVVSLAVGVVTALALSAYWSATRHADWRSDWDASYSGAEALLAGRDPYTASWSLVTPKWPWPLAYPLPALLVAAPFTVFPLPVARCVFLALTVGLLAFGLTRRGWWGLALLLSGPALQAIGTAQWTLLLSAAVLLPAWGWVVTLKPTAGLVVLAGHRTWRDLLPALLGATTMLAASLLLWPGWLTAWGAALSGGKVPVGVIALYPLSAVSLLGWLRWRHPAGRMLGTLALVPHTSSPYNLLPVLVALDRRRPALLVSVLSALSLLPWIVDYSRFLPPRWWFPLLIHWPLTAAVLFDPPRRSDVQP